MSQSGKLETISPSLRKDLASAPVVTTTNVSAGKSLKVGKAELQISSDRSAAIETPGSINISLDRSATGSAAFFSVQNLLSILPGWSVSLVGHGAALVLLAVIATSPLHDGEAVRLDGLMLDATEVADAQDIQNETELTESDLLKIDVAALNSEASEDTAEIVREDGFAVSLMEGMADGIGMDAMANTGLTPIEVSDEGGVQGNTEGKSTQFFGTEATGSRFIFIIDGSGSMTQGFRWHQAVREVEKSIGQLTEKQEALVLVYNFQTFPMFHTPPADLKLLPVTEDFKAALSQWLNGLTPIGGTRPAHALNYSLSLKPDAIFLLSDGLLADNSIHVLARKNKFPDPENDGEVVKIPIHAVSLGPDEDGAELMKLIAENNDGQFNWVR